MKINVFDQNNIIINDKNKSGSGWIEEYSCIEGEILGRFFIGAFSSIGADAKCENAFIGRFTSIEQNVQVGYKKVNPSLFSMHSFARGEKGKIKSEYLDILESRYYYETSRYTFIGSDVFIGKNSIIQEGVRIGDGALVYPMSFVCEDVPEYAIVAGNPAVVIGYRFEKSEIIKLLKSKWWTKNLTPCFLHEKNKKKKNIINYNNNIDLINQVSSDEIKNLTIKRFDVNFELNSFKENLANTMIVGASHIVIWYNKYMNGQLEKPQKCHLIPIPAMSLFSNQLMNLVGWWSEWFEDIILFVPDFRIGNVTVDDVYSDGRYVDKNLINHENSLKCFNRGIQVLSIFEKKYKIKFWFWSLFGREALNKQRGKYISGDKYKHPIWNYDDLYHKYGRSTLDINKYFNPDNINEFIVDDSIHPTNKAYKKMIAIFDKYK